MQLLFFDTFSHEVPPAGSTAAGSSDLLNLDLVQFPSPVCVREVRIVPLGAKVHSNLPGGARMGATNPAKFELELFVNNLRAQGASTFESVGNLGYDAGDTISLACTKYIPTDGLVLRGTYSALTLAVYGIVTDLQEQTRTPASVQESSSVRHDDLQRIKEEPVRPPESPLPDAAGRSIGESYAAAWTAKHSEVALKAEPPADWLNSDGLKTEVGLADKVRIKKEDDMNHLDSREMWSKSRRSISPGGRDLVSGSPPRKLRRSRSFSPGDPISTRERYPRRSGSRDRLPRSQSRELLPRRRSDSRDRGPAGRRSQSRELLPRRSGSRLAARRPDSRLGARGRSGSRDRLALPRRSGSRGSGGRFRSKERSPGGYNYISRSRENSLERSRYRSRSIESPHGGGGPRPRSLSRNGRRSRDGSKDSYPVRSFNNSLKDSYRRTRSRSPSVVGVRSPLSRSPPLKYNSRPGSRDRPLHHSPLNARGGVSGGGSRARSRSPRMYRSPLPGFEHKSPVDYRRRDGSRDFSPRSGGRVDRFGARYSRERSRSPPRDYDKNSLQSSGSRRHFSPRRNSISPRRRSISPRLRGSPPLNARYPARSRSPYDASGHPISRSPDMHWKKRFSPPLQALHRSPSRNGHHEVYNAAVQPVTVLHHPVVGLPSPGDDGVGAQDTLDNVSDISDGDIPDIPEPEQDPMEVEAALEDRLEQDDKSIVEREDVEEISDEEAEWSDDFEPLNRNAPTTTIDFEGLEQLENPVVKFDINNPPQITALKYWMPTPFGGFNGGDIRTTCQVASQQNRTTYKPRNDVTGEGGDGDQYDIDVGEGENVDEHLTANGVNDESIVDPIEGKVEEVMQVFRRLDTNQDEQIDETWIEKLEQLTQLLAADPTFVDELLAAPEQLLAASGKLLEDFALLPEYNDADSRVRALTLILNTGLDYDIAMKQGKGTNKLRHLKSGMKLLLQLISSGPRILHATKIINLNIIQRLWSVYSEEHMCVPVKLLVLRTLDKVLDSQEGMQAFISSTVHQEMSLALTGAKERTRTKFALKSILNKVSLCETVEEMLKQLELLDTTTQTSTNKNVMSRLIQCVKELERTFLNLDTLMSHPSRYLPCTHKFNLNKDIFHRPERGYFSVLSWASGGVLDIITSILCYISTCENVDDDSLFDSMIEESHVPHVVKYNLLSSVYSLLSCWSYNLEGLMFLAGNTCQIQNLVSVLLPVAGDGSKGHLPLDNIDQSGRFLFIYRLYTFLYLDAIQAEQQQLPSSLDVGNNNNKSVAKNRRQMETETMLSTMQALYGITFSSLGRQALVQVLAMEDNLSCLLRLCHHSDMEKGVKDMKKSGIRGYANELVLTCVRNSEDLGFITKYAKELYSLGKHDEHSKLSELVLWMKPVQQPSKLHSEQGIQGVLDYLRKGLETTACLVSPQNITSLRILANLVIPNYSRDNSDLELRDLAWQYKSLLLFSSDTLELLINLIQKICEDHLQPRQHTSSFLGSRGNMILAVLRPAIYITAHLIHSVIKVRGTTFRDHRALGTLVRVHLLLAVVPPASPYYTKACKAMAKLEGCLLAHTQPRIDPLKDNISKSLWTEMMREVISQVLSTPCNYISGLHLLSQLLPLPLPAPAPFQLTADQRTASLNTRTLWSAHLHPLHDILQEFVCTLGGVGSGLLRCLLQKVCEQLAGLAPPTSTAILRSIITGVEERLDVCKPAAINLLHLLEHLLTFPHLKAAFLSLLDDEKNVEDFINIIEACLNNQDESSETALSILYTLLDLNQSLASKPADLPASKPLLAAEGSPATQQYLADSLPPPTVIASLLNCLLTPVSLKKDTDVDAKTDKNVSINKDQDSTEPPLAAAAETAGDTDINIDNDTTEIPLVKEETPLRTTIFSIQQLKIRTLSLMLKSDITFSILKSCLNSTAKRHRTFYALAEFIVREFDTTNDMMTDWFVLFVKYLTDLCSLEGVSGLKRLSANEMAWLMDFPQAVVPADDSDVTGDEGDITQHPLLVLRDLLNSHMEAEADTEADSSMDLDSTPQTNNNKLKFIQDSLSGLISVLEEATSSPDSEDPALGLAVTKLETEEDDWWISLLPAPTPILTQWFWRQLERLPNSDSGSHTSAILNGDVDISNNKENGVDAELSINQQDGGKSCFKSSDVILNELSLASWWNNPDSVKTGNKMVPGEVDLVDVSARYLDNIDLIAEVHLVCKESSMAVGLDRKVKKVKRSALETKAAHNKTIITSFKSGASINLRSSGHPRSYRGSYSRGDMFRARPPNTSRPPSLHVDDFLMLEQKGQQPTGPTGYNKQSAKAAKELFAQREAAAALQPPSHMREATREPVALPYRSRGRGGGDFMESRGRGRGRGRGGPGGYRPRGGGDGVRGWSPEYRSSEPRDLGREARPGPRIDRYSRGPPRGGGDRERRGSWDRGRGRGGRGKDHSSDRGRHARIYSR